MVLTVPKAVKILIVFKKIVFLNSVGQLSLKQIVGNNKLQENMVHMALKSMESYGVYDWLEKDSTRWVARSHVPQARKLLCIEEFFLATKRVFKILHKGGILLLCFSIL